MVLFLRLRSPEQSLEDERRFHEEPFEYEADLETAVKTVSLDLSGPERIECPSPSRVPRSGKRRERAWSALAARALVLLSLVRLYLPRCLHGFPFLRFPHGLKDNGLSYV